MTKITSFDLTPFYRNTVGIDRLFDRITQQIDHAAGTNYPPYNIVETGEHTFELQLAVAGFGKDDVDIELNDGTLIIRGEKKNKENTTYLYRGIATRTFTKSIRLNDTIEVRGAELNDGILKIALENVIPDHKKPRKIAIGNQLNFNLAKSQLLTETTV